MSNPIYTFDFTLSYEKCQSAIMIIQDFKNRVKKYGFQLEQGEGDNDYKHFQGRISLIKKKRLHDVIKLFQDTCLAGAHFSVASTNSTKEDFYSYCEKIDTRIGKPYKDSDPDPPYVPRQCRDIKLYEWQQYIIDDIDVWNTRNINVVFNPTGNIGKSTLIQYVRAYELGCALPLVNDYKDIMRMVCNLPTSKLYLIDMPKAIKKDKLHQFYSGIETIKDGFCYDDRYAYKQKCFDCPNIWVFTNTLPDFDLLSKDRWNVWTVEKNKKSLQNINHVHTPIYDLYSDKSSNNDINILASESD